MHPFLTINGRLISSYDFMTLLSIIFAATYFYKGLWGAGVKGGQIGWYIFIGIFVQDIGGTILPYLHHLIHGIPIPALPRTPGRWFHSIFLSMLVYTFLWIRRFKWPAGRVMDFFFLSAMIMSAVGRVGCFLGGCCTGKVCDPTAVPWLPALHFPADPQGVFRHPAQLYMCGLEFLIFFVTRWLDRRRNYDGQTFWRGVLIYSVYRFLIGFVRDTPALFAGFSYAQLFSILTAAGSAAALARFSRKK